jgi:pilus assembly protein CpaB
VSRRRRAALLLGLALVLGALAGSDVARREAAVRAQLGPPVPVVVAGRPLAGGRRLTRADLAVRRIPARWVLPGAVAAADALVGRRLAVAVPAGGPVTADGLALAPGAAAPALRPGERAADVVAAGPPAEVAPGARVDVLVTRDGDAGGAPGGAELALQDVEVLAARRASAAETPRGSDASGPLVAATLRVGVRQAVFLAAAQSFAREIRLLVRAPGDRRHDGGVRVGADLGARP